MFGFLRRIFRKRAFCAWSVDDSAGGYRVDDLLIRRSDVVVIVAFKRDLITIDQLCLGLGHGEPDADGGCAVMYIEEDNPSYPAVLADLQQHFDLVKGWWEHVTRLPFETTWTIIWSKDGQVTDLAGQRGAAAGDRPRAGDRD